MQRRHGGKRRSYEDYGFTGCKKYITRQRAEEQERSAGSGEELMARSGKIDDVEAYRIQENFERSAQDAGI